MAARLIIKQQHLRLSCFPRFVRSFLQPKRYASSVNYPLELSSVSENHAAWYEESLKNPEAFWGDLARRRLRWIKEFDQVMDCNMNEGKISWFNGGKINVTENLLDRHVKAHPDKTAIIWERDEPGDSKIITYKKLLEMTCQVANLLKRDGVKKGDRVAIYMPVSPLLVASMLACARIGAIHSVVFAGFSAEALRTRIVDASASIVITSDQGIRGGKLFPLKDTVDKAIEGLDDTVKRVYVARRTGGSVSMKSGRDVQLQEAMSKESITCPPEPLDSEDILFMLYTSGSTGKPKGIVHTQAGYLLYGSVTQQYAFDYHPDKEVFACVADVGWIAGHTCVVYGPLCLGGTGLMFESIPTYPNPGRYWEMVERLKLTHIYLAPTALRMLLKAGDEWVTKYDRSSLRILGCVGEPLNDEAWLWYHNVVGDGRCTVVDTWWQTETSGVMISPRPSPDNSTPKPGFPTRPFYGVDLTLVDEMGQELVGPNVSGNLCIKKPWPGMARTIWNDHEKYVNTYFSRYPGLYFSGDGALRDEDGDYQITGRVDDVINIKGHRVGTAELESCMDHDPRVAEAAVVGFPHDTFGEDIYAFVILMDGVTDSEEEIIKDLQQLIRKHIGGFAVPQSFLIVPGLPKTRSGKILRRILKKIAAGNVNDFGDISTLADPSIVNTIIQKKEQF